MEEALHAVFYLNLVGPAEGVEFLHVNELAHGAVGLGGVEFYGALEAYGLDDEFREFADGEFLSCAHIDMAVADFTKARDIATTTSRMVAVHHTICSYTVVYAGVFLYSNNIFKINIQKDMNKYDKGQE